MFYNIKCYLTFRKRRHLWYNQLEYFTIIDISNSFFRETLTTVDELRLLNADFKYQAYELLSLILVKDLHTFYTKKGSILDMVLNLNECHKPQNVLEVDAFKRFSSSKTSSMYIKEYGRFRS